uniref:U-actitoxin-Avd9b n=1 Tax=Anemonia viridis TaxID=51769 RepID=K1B9B_ANEVI|nr:RecName: Full=U-actitoxin-Avd9b; Short=U-AITX-Avd9b; AltName: Full=Potassium channel toxin avtx-7; Flags: Precursor [Anemonia viridis]
MNLKVLAVFVLCAILVVVTAERRGTETGGYKKDTLQDLKKRTHDCFDRYREAACTSDNIRLLCKTSAKYQINCKKSCGLC